MTAATFTRSTKSSPVACDPSASTRSAAKTEPREGGLALRDFLSRAQRQRAKSQRRVRAAAADGRRSADDKQVLVIVRATPRIHDAAPGIITHATTARWMILEFVDTDATHGSSARFRQLGEHATDFFFRWPAQLD